MQEEKYQERLEPSMVGSIAGWAAFHVGDSVVVKKDGDYDRSIDPITQKDIDLKDLCPFFLLK